MSGWLTPTKITAWLECRHTMTLRRRVEAGAMAKPAPIDGSMGRLLQQKGDDHERSVLERYRAGGLTVFDAETLKPASGDWDEWVAACADVLDGDHDIVFQMPFVHDGMRGVADFLVRPNGPDGPGPGWEPVDAKLARAGAKVGHVLQLCFYADATEAATGHAAEHLHVHLGSGEVETIRRAEVDAYWQRLKMRLRASLDDEVTTRAEPCSYCGFCEYAQVCESEWTNTDSLVTVANLSKKDRHQLEAADITTMAELAASANDEVGEIDPGKLATHRVQAQLQVAGRELPDDASPPFEMIDVADAAAATDPDAAPRGWAMLPPPDEGDVFLDFEGHPFWRADSELFFLFGLIERDDRPAAERHPSGWRFRKWWAHSKAEEAAAVASLVAYLAERRAAHPGMHVYHYNHTERSALERLTTEHHTSELTLDQLVRAGVFVDLYRVVLGAVQIGAESYSLKEVEHLTGYERVAGIEKGAGAVADYDDWMTDGDQARLDRIAAYNDDDVRATRAVRDWLLDHKPAGAPSWQPPEPREGEEELDYRIAALQEFESGSTEHFLGDLLGYWRRERRIVAMNTFLLATAPAATRRESASVFDAPKVVAVEDRIGVKGNVLKGAQFTLTHPPQATPIDLDDRGKVVQVVDEKTWLFFDVVEHDRGARLLVVETTKSDESPSSGAPLVEYDDVKEKPKDAAVHDVADQFIAGEPPVLAERLLRAEAPSFAAGVGPVDGVFTSDLDAIRSWITEIDGQVVPIQGPPGTGKTYSGSRLIKHLVDAGKRVGIVAQSHAAIDNLVKAVAEHYESSGEIGRLRLGRKTDKDAVHEAVTCINDNDKIGAGEFDIVAGTSWFFTSKAMRTNPVDVLVVDEAGQLGLVDLVACSVSAGSMLLLGDPQQLPQVSQATHPNGSGESCLGHLLGSQATVPADRGVLLETTWRMHPDVCGYISDTFYEGKLTTHGSCDVQTTSDGTGLRWIAVESEGCATESAAEAEAICDEIARLLDGGTWTRRADPADGSSALITTPLTGDDVLVVVPYNDQRRLVSKVLADAGFGGVRVGTVDKFQGQEAPIVFFSMTSSTTADMPRGLDFLFSRNRVNVAISRARCLAYLVCTEGLLDADASDIDDMRRIGAVTSLADRAIERDGPLDLDAHGLPA